MLTTLSPASIGDSGWSTIIIRQEATTAIRRLHAANAAEDTIQLIDFFSEVNTTTVINIAAEMPPKKALTKDNCSATATIKLGEKSDMVISVSFCYFCFNS